MSYSHITFLKYPTAIAIIFLFIAVNQLRAQTKPVADTSAPVTDIGWPRLATKDGAKMIYYQPQIDEWKDYKEISGRVAFALTPKGGKETLGVASFKCGTNVDKDARTVYFHDVVIESTRFPSLDQSAIPAMEALVKELLPQGGEPISVDRLMADVDNKKIEAQPVAVKNDPPEIFYSTTPAILLMIQGEPALAPVEKTDLQFVVNTNWDVFYDKSKKNYYLLADKYWYTSNDLKSSWTATGALPKDLSKLPSGENFDDVKKMVPPPSTPGAAPKVFYSDKPAELILTKGSPVYAPLSNTTLLYVSNTDNDVFLDDSDKTFYVLFSGRWFRSKALTEGWTYAGNDLPASFAKIPSNSPKASVLASVPGTIEASDAIMLAQIPTTVVVNKKEAEQKVKVSYDGAPQFKPIDSTHLEYATNTQDKIIKDGDLYYLCFQGIWFMSTSPNGPWLTAEAVPKEIYTIPPSSPLYNVTYVTQTNATETTVESSTTAGYFGMFVLGMTAGAILTYGTGYYYPPYFYWGPGALYPIYRPWPCTFGAGAVYNPWTGGYAVGRGVYGPYGAAQSAAWYNPATGRYGRSASVQGWYGGRTAASAYNPWTGGYAATSQGHNAYSQWGSSVATRNGQWAQTGHVTTANGTAFGYRTSTGQQGVITHGANGSVAHTTNGTYAGHDGNVYRKDANGWSKYNNGNWNQVQKPNNNLSGETQHTWQGLNHSAEARQRGQANTQRFQNFHSQGGFRGGGGGFRGRR